MEIVFVHRPPLESTQHYSNTRLLKGTGGMLERRVSQERESIDDSQEADIEIGILCLLLAASHPPFRCALA